MTTDDSMRHADVANGEDPEEVGRQPAGGVGKPERDPRDGAQIRKGDSHPTGESQAEENRDNDPPA